MSVMTDYNKILFEQLLLHVPCAIYWRDCKGRYLGCNQLFAQHVGLPVQDIVGKTDAQLPWGTHDGYRIDQETMHTLTVTERTEERQLIDQTLTLRITRIPLLNQGRVIGILGIAVDITEQYKLRFQADVANQLKKAFISDMEHDMRTPLSGIWGTADFLMSNETDPDKKDSLHNISDCAKELLDYCNEMITLSKIEKHPTPVLSKIFNLQQLMESVLQMQLPAAQHKKLDLKCRYANELPTMLKGDPRRIKQILLNLIGNAIKFTEQGYVYFNATCLQRDKRHIVVSISVIDSGIGVPLEKRDWIFETFTKVAPSNSGRSNGQGIGLYLVKRLIEDLDGDIHLQTELGKGSTFTLHIPFKIPLCDLTSDSDQP